MTATVHPLHACRRCGAPAKPTDFVVSGTGEAFSLNVCPGCIAEGQAYLARVHPVFEAMIAAGIDREIANDAMVYLHARMSEGTVRR